MTQEQYVLYHLIIFDNFLCLVSPGSCHPYVLYGTVHSLQYCFKSMLPSSENKKSTLRRYGFLRNSTKRLKYLRVYMRSPF